MKRYFFEATNGPNNWGKFMVVPMVDEMTYPSEVTGRPLLPACGWGPQHLWVMDLQTGEGAVFQPGGSASADLNKHQIWVCVLFEHFLSWLYKQDTADLAALPKLIDFPEAPMALAGHRRPGRR